MTVDNATGKTARPVQERRSLESVDRTVRVLRAFDAKGGLNLAEIARRSDLSEATALRYLSSLANHGMVLRTPGNRYQLGWELFRLGQLAVENRVPRAVALPIMEQLVDRFNETVNLALRQGDELVIVEVLEGTRTVKKVNEVGQLDPWHASALGKAMLAWMPDEEWRGLVKRNGLTPLTEHSITRMADFERELKDVRRKGVAFDRQETEEGLTCVAAPVMGPGGAPSFALSVSFLTHRLTHGGLDEAASVVREAADELKSRLSLGQVQTGS